MRAEATVRGRVRAVNRVELALLLCLGLSALLAGTYLLGRHHGGQAARVGFERSASRAFVAEYRRAVEATAEILRIGRQLAADLRDSQVREPETVVVVRREVANAPEFAAVRRPAELQRLRRAQLEAIGAAAAGGVQR